MGNSLEVDLGNTLEVDLGYTLEVDLGNTLEVDLENTLSQTALGGFGPNRTASSKLLCWPVEFEIN